MICKKRDKKNTCGAVDGGCSDKNSGKKIRLLPRLIVAAVLILLLIALIMLNGDSGIAEYAFARGFSRVYLAIVSKISSFFPFSLYELMIAALVIAAAVFLVRSVIRLKRRSFRSLIAGVLSVSITTLSIVNVYIATASFSYNRRPIYLGIEQLYAQPDRVPEIAAYFLQDFNDLSQKMQRDENGSVISPYDFNTLAAKCVGEFKQFNGDSYYNDILPRPKSMLFSEIMSMFQFSGVFFAPLAEPNINTNAPASGLPVTILHELAHAAGIMREREANYIAYFLALTSKDDFIRYSGYSATFYRFASGARVIEYLRSPDGSSPITDNIIQSIAPEIEQDLYNAALYWQQKSSFISGITEKINDFYLKLSGVPEGTGNYVPTPPQYEDTGEVDEYQRPVIEITYSLLQQMYFFAYILAGYGI